MATKAKLSSHNGDLSGLSQYPSLQLWLKVVGISSGSQLAFSKAHVLTLDALMDKTSDLNRILLLNSELSASRRQEECRRLSRALHNLRNYTNILIHGNVRYPSGDQNLELHWDSWDSQSSTKSNLQSQTRQAVYKKKVSRHHGQGHHHQHRDESASPKQESNKNSDTEWPSTPFRNTIPKVDSAASSLSSCSSMPPPSPGGPNNALSPPVVPQWSVVADRKLTPPTTPPWSIIIPNKDSKNNRGENKREISTPPPVRKHSTGIQKSDCALIKSQSHESELMNRINVQPTVKEIAIVSEAMQKPLKTNYSQASSSNYTISSTASTGMRQSMSDMPLSAGQGGSEDHNHTKIATPR